MPKHVIPPVIQHTFIYREEQIIGTQDKPQRLVVQRLLSRLQYLVCTKSSTRDLSHAHDTLQLAGVIFSDWYQPLKSGRNLYLYM